jgi:hypothetical protein
MSSGMNDKTSLIFFKDRWIKNQLSIFPNVLKHCIITMDVRVGNTVDENIIRGVPDTASYMRG